jgi:hypothetical protein
MANCRVIRHIDRTTVNGGCRGNLPQVKEGFIGRGIAYPHIQTPFVSGVEFVSGILLLAGRSGA